MGGLAGDGIAVPSQGRRCDWRSEMKMAGSMMVAVLVPGVTTEAYR